MKNRDYEDIGILAGFALFVTLIVFFLGFNIYSTFFTDAHVNIKVDRLERIVDNNKSKYLVYATKDPSGKPEVFENVDRLLRAKKNSSDVYAYLATGEKKNIVYDCKVQGFRIPLFSYYRNILECKQKG